MKLYDVWFTPDRDKMGPNAKPSCPESYRGIDLPGAKELLGTLRLAASSALGTYSIKAASTWAREGLSWWAGSNEERYTIGPCATREEAFLAALAEQWGEVHLCEAARSRPTVPDMVDLILERYEESNEELGDPEGDGFSIEVTGPQERDLQKRFTSMFEDWLSANRIETETFMFDPCYPAPATAINLQQYLLTAIPWSFETFGPGSRGAGVIDHIRKEIEEAKTDPSEWVDIAILALDGAWRSLINDHPRTTPDAEWLALWISGQAERLNTHGPDWEVTWQRVLNSPAETFNWVALHVVAMQQWGQLHEFNAKDRPLYHQLFTKLTINQLRVWPDWRGNELRAIEHDRSV